MYLTALKNHLHKILTEQTINSYDEIFRLSDGAFPTTVYELIKSEKAFLNNDNTVKKIVEEDPFLPEPSPVNFDWRFDRKTLAYLLNLIKDSNCKRIALFGVPSLFQLLKNSNYDVFLFDINETLKDYLKSDDVWIGDLNLLDVKNHQPFDCVIMDPPWYIQYYETWLIKANTLIRNDGLIMSTLFEPLLRPSAKRELNKIVNIARNCGDYKIQKKAIVYKTPRFEKEMFLSMNIPCYGDWRTADLLQITKKQDYILPLTIPEADPWIRLIFNRQLIAIKSEHFHRQLTIKFPYSGNEAEIRSVSNRDKTRKRLNFITSRNKGLIITGGDKLIEILSRLNAEETLLNIVKELMLSSKEIKALNQILNLIRNN